jgi:prophage tail gpP-like protein
MAGVLDAAVGAVTAPMELARRLVNSVTVLVGVKKFLFEGWESIRIQRSMDQCAGSFSLSFVDKWRQTFLNWELTPGSEILVNIGPLPVLRGYIDRLDVTVTNEDRRLEITGRDATADLVDSSAPTFPSEFKFVTIAQLAAIFITPHKIPWAIDVPPGPPFEKFTVRQGESVFDLLSRAAQFRGLMLQATEIGGLLITDRSSVLSRAVSPAPLVQGINIVEASGAYDYSDRFAQYNIRGQSRGNELVNRKMVTQLTGIALDPVMALRPARQKTIVVDGSVDLLSVQEKANFEASARASKALDVQIKVQGWRQDIAQLGPLWRPNQIVFVQAPFIGIQSAQMLIRSVQFNKSLSDGTTTTLGLTRPDAYIPKIPVVNPVFDATQNLGWLFSPLQELI